MGMFDYVQHDHACPGCGEPCSWQTKDGPQEGLAQLQPEQVGDFYGGCDSVCGVWIHYIKKSTPEGQSILKNGHARQVKSDLTDFVKLDFTASLEPDGFIY